MRDGVRRRTVLLGAAGVAAIGAGGAAGVWSGVLPGRSRLRRELGIGQVDVPAPAVNGPDPRYDTFASAARGRDVTWGWAVPEGSQTAGLPVVLVLPGRAAPASAAFDGLGAHRFLAEHVAGGGAPFALVAVGGDSSYWHPRRDGDDPLAMLGSELFPRLRDLGFALDRLGVLGWSMGGFGGLLLAREASAGRFAEPGALRAVAVSSPALFADAGSTAAGAFDDAADFRNWGALADDPAVEGIPLSVSCGVDDPFCATTRRYRERCDPAPAGEISDGDHSMGYWRSRVPEQFSFLGTQLRATAKPAR